jgi:hypothetical protein
MTGLYSTGFQEQEGGMSVELGDDATYPVRGVGSISFQMPSCDVLELDNFVCSWVEEESSFSVLYDRCIVDSCF